MNSSKYKLFSLFLCVCFPIRLTIAILSYLYIDECTYMCRATGGSILLIISFSFVKQYSDEAGGFFRTLGKFRDNLCGGSKSTKVAPAWWQPLRVLHMVLFFLAGSLLWGGSKWVWTVLMFDVAVGFIASLINLRTQKDEYINSVDNPDEWQQFTQ